MLLWRASGAHSSRSWSTTVITEAGRRQLERSRNISSSSITASAARPGWGSCHPRRMSRDSMPDYQQHERFGVHYLRPTSNGRPPRLSRTAFTVVVNKTLCSATESALWAAMKLFMNCFIGLVYPAWFSFRLKNLRTSSVSLIRPSSSSLPNMALQLVSPLTFLIISLNGPW